MEGLFCFIQDNQVTKPHPKSILPQKQFNKTTIMKKLPFFFLLLMAVQCSFGQNYQSCLVQSRNGSGVTVPFDVNKKLAALSMNERNLQNNTLYQIIGKQATFYIFKGISRNANLLNNINWSQPQSQPDPNDIYVSENQYGVVVLRRGDFEFKSYNNNNQYSITRLIATLDTIPKDEYYYDYRADNTKIKKDCYHTDQNENFAQLDFQGASNITTLPPSIENVFVEKHSSIIKFDKRRNQSNNKNDWGMILNFNQRQANLLKRDDAIYTFYKLQGISTTFRLLVDFDFGCKKSNNKQSISGGTIISPPDKPFKQPDPSGLGATPPN